MWPDRVSSPGPLPLESDALPTSLRGPARKENTEGMATELMISAEAHFFQHHWCGCRAFDNS